MDGFHQLVGIGGEDGESLEVLSFFGFPALPDVRESTRLAGSESNRIGRLVFLSLRSELKGFAVRSFGNDFFGARIDGGVSEFGFARQERHEAPVGQANSRLAELRAETKDGLALWGVSLKVGANQGKSSGTKPNQSPSTFWVERRANG
jgi:hypothetical protein